MSESVDSDHPSSITLEMMRRSLYTAVVSDALDRLGYRNQSPRVAWRMCTVDGLLVGRCKTTLWADMYHQDPRPYQLELAAVDSCEPDDVVICAAGGSTNSALWGELLSTAAANQGAVGAIVDGMVRDTVKMRAMAFSVYALGALPYDSLHRQRVVDLDVAVEIEGTRFQPGDLVFADADGVVVVPREVEAEAVREAWQKVHAENLVRDAIRGGMKAGEAFDRFGIL